MSRHGWLTWWLSLVIVVVLTAPAFTETTEDTKHSDPLDPFQQAVVDSLKFPERTTPQELLDAAIRAASVEALDPTSEFLEKFDEALDRGHGIPKIVSDGVKKILLELIQLPFQGYVMYNRDHP